MSRILVLPNRTIRHCADRDAVPASKFGWKLAGNLRQLLSFDVVSADRTCRHEAGGKGNKYYRGEDTSWFYNPAVSTAVPLFGSIRKKHKALVDQYKPTGLSLPTFKRMLNDPVPSRVVDGWQLPTVPMLAPTAPESTAPPSAAPTSAAPAYAAPASAMTTFTAPASAAHASVAPISRATVTSPPSPAIDADDELMELATDLFDSDAIDTLIGTGMCLSTLLSPLTASFHPPSLALASAAASRLHNFGRFCDKSWFRTSRELY